MLCELPPVVDGAWLPVPLAGAVVDAKPVVSVPLAAPVVVAVV